MYTIIATGANLDIGSTVDWYVTIGTQNPYVGDGELIGSSPVVGDPCQNEPEILYIMVNPDNTQAGGSGDQCDEFIVMWTGSGGFNTSDILVSNLGPGSFEWDGYVAGNAANFSCGTALPPGPVPENAILVIQSSTTNNIPINIDNLCASGLPVYIIAYDGTSSCTGGYFDNNDPCASCPVMVDITGASCQFSFELDYMPPTNSVDGWAWANTGSGAYLDVVPVLNIPEFTTDGILVEDYVWTVPADFCENYAGEATYIVGIVNPPPPSGCALITTPWYGFGVECGEVALSGGGEVCEGNCPEDPTEIIFTIDGNGTPYIADLLVTASVFPPFEIEDVEISNGYALSVCLEGFFPSFDPATGILNVPILAIGISATVEIVSLSTSAGCPVEVDPNSVTLTFIGAPSANAGNDQVICEGQSAMLSGSVGGSATSSVWTTDGDGTFSNPNILNPMYIPGAQDILNGQVILTLSATDPNGTCIPATSTMVLTIEPSWSIDLGPTQTVCSNDIVNVNAMISGPAVSGTWSTSGDGDFDNANAESTFYIPGVLDLATGSVVLFYALDDNGPCVPAPAELQVNFLEAPDVDVPSNIEVCSDDNVTIHIGLSGDYTTVVWSTAGDGVLVVVSDQEVNYTPGSMDIANQFVILSVTVTSVHPECGQTTYNLPIDVIMCDCPPFTTVPPADALCSASGMLDLTSLLVEGGAGSWAITSNPPGLNPAFLSGSIFTTSNADPGIYTVTYTLSSPEVGCPATSSENILVESPVTASVGQDQAFCGPQSVMFSGTVVPSSGYALEWVSSGDGIFSNPASLNTVYTPGAVDSVSSGLYIVLNVLDTVCGTQSDTATQFFNSPPFTVFSTDSAVICNAFGFGSVLDFNALIIGGDQTGTWNNTSGLAIDFSNPSAVNFDGVAEGWYHFEYTTASAVSPCANVTYGIEVNVRECDCPLLIVQNVPGGICNSQPILPLDPFLMSGGPGTWQVIQTPPGVNPATITGSILNINGCDPGTYVMRFTLDAAPLPACPDSAELSIFIQEVITLAVAGDTATCGTSMINVSALAGGSATGVVWTTSGSGIFANPASEITTYTPSANDVASAFVEITVSTMDTFGFCPIQRDTIPLFLVTPPSTTFSVLTDTLCNHPDSGSVINLTGYIVEGDGTGFWTDADGSMVDLTDPAQVDFNGVAAGEYRLIYTTQTAVAPCTDSMYVFTVVVEDCACPSLILDPGPVFLCQGTTADLDDQIIDAAPGAWAISMGPAGIWPVITGSTMTTTNAAGGSYELTYVLTDSVPGCPASARIGLDIEAPPLFVVQDVICDAAQTYYEIVLETDAANISADFGKVIILGVGEFNIDSVPVGQDVIITASGASGICQWTFPVSAPDCNCTLMIEDIADTIRFCPGDTFVLIPIITGAQGLPFSTWITPSGTKMQPTLPLYEPGMYIWIVRDMAGCEERDTFYAEFLGPQEILISVVSPSCPGKSDGQIIVESISGGMSPYLLMLDDEAVVMPSQYPYVFQNIDAGQHSLSVFDLNDCELVSPIVVNPAVPGSLELGPDVVIRLGDSTWIDPDYSGFISNIITWTPANINIDLEPFWFGPEMTSLLEVTVTDTSGCIYSDQLLVTVFEEENIYVPNVFSPNGDQINDALIVSTNFDEQQLLSLEIYDRWGGFIYQQIGNYPLRWDGTSKGKQVQTGVYVYKLVWKNQSGEEKVILGDVTVIK
jgi:gliding motility-associated-like protein